MLSNAYFLAKFLFFCILLVFLLVFLSTSSTKFRFDTAENEPAKNLQNFQKNAFSKNAFFTMRARQVVLEQHAEILALLDARDAEIASLKAEVVALKDQARGCRLRRRMK